MTLEGTIRHGMSLSTECVSDVMVIAFGPIGSYVDLSGYYTKTEIDGKGYLTEHQDISGKADKATTYTKSETNGLLNAKQDTLTFDAVPTEDSANPVTSGGLYTKFLYVAADIADKQDALVSGTNIKTVNSVSLLGSGDIDADDVIMGKIDGTSFYKVIGYLGRNATPTFSDTAEVGNENKIYVDILTNRAYRWTKSIVSLGESKYKLLSEELSIITDNEINSLLPPSTKKAISAKVLRDNFYTETEVNNLLSGKADTSTTYTKTEVNSALDDKQDTIADLATIRSGAALGATAYQKPNGGIPKSDFASSVQTSLGLADSALQQHQDLSTLADGAEYDSSAKKIYLKHGNTRLSNPIDATAFIKDGMIDTVTVTNGNLVISFNTDAGKQPISLPISDIFNANNYYTKTEIDNKGYLTSETDPVFTASVAHGITSSDIANWNSKTSNVGTITGITMNGASKGTSGVVDLGTVITEHQDISGKVDKETGKGLSSNDYTDAEKTKLSGIATGAEVNVQSDWNQTTTTADDYIKNKPSLATVATSGSYSDLSNKPTIPTVNNATLTIQKNGTTVGTFTANASSNVTANISVPTKVSDLTNDSGFVTGSKMYIGTCDTAAATNPKDCTVETFPLNNGEPLDGTTICVRFAATDTSTSTSPTLNVNNTGAKKIWYNNELLATAKSSLHHGYANRYIYYVYDSSLDSGNGAWVWLGCGYDSNTTYSNASLGQGYAEDTRSSAVAAVTASISSYALSVGGVVSIHFKYDVPANATLNIRSRGAKAIYYKNAPITAGVIKAGDTATFIYTTYYHLISIDRSEGADLTNYYTKTEIDTKIGNIETLLANI